MELSRGIYCVAFGEPARACAAHLMATLGRHLPEIPIALCAARPIGPETVFIERPDSDVGGRRAKLLAYELAPAAWNAVLYLDADTEVISPAARFFFELVESGWDFAISTDPPPRDTLHSFQRSYNAAEFAETSDQLHTLNALQYNGGVWAFGRNPQVAAFFARWLAEWERHAQKDQGALLRALHAEPLRLFVLGTEWNYFPRYSPKEIEPAAILHHPGTARRWEGMIPGRIDVPAAWEHVRRFDAKRRTNA